MILVTGGRGFVGQKLVNFLQESGTHFISLVRSNCKEPKEFEVPMPENVSPASLKSCFDELGYKIDSVIHCAGLAHGKLKDASYSDYQKVNVSLTKALAMFLLDVGGNKFIFLSTIGVHGRTSVKPVSELSSFSPYDFYSNSKLEAERQLTKIFENEKLADNLVIIRPPLIVGSNAPGNFGKLVKLCDLPVPMPFGLITNRRTVLSVDNLISFIDYALSSSGVTGVYTLADDEVISTKDIAREIKGSLGRKALMVPVPPVLIRLLSSIVGKRQIYEQLCDDLVVDNAKAKSHGWEPVVTSLHTLRNAARLSVADKIQD